MVFTVRPHDIYKQHVRFGLNGWHEMRPPCNSRFIHWYHVTFDTWPTVSLLKLTLFRWCGCRPRVRYVDLLTLTDLVTVQVLARLHGHSITCAHRTTYTRRSPVMAPFVPEIYDLVTLTSSLKCYRELHFAVHRVRMNSDFLCHAITLFMLRAHTRPSTCKIWHTACVRLCRNAAVTLTFLPQNWQNVTQETFM